MGRLSSEEKVKRVLTAVNKVLGDAKDKTAARNLWNILTALRGPDSDNTTVKQYTTAQIRYLVGEISKTPFAHTNVGAIVQEFKPTQFGKHKDTNDHFRAHIRYALEALHEIGVITLEQWNTASRPKQND